MHSSRMRTACSSSRHGGVSTPPRSRHPLWSRHPPRAGIPLEQTSPQLDPLNFSLGVDLDQIPLNFPLGCGPGSGPPQLPPWVWAWSPPPGQIPLNFPLGCGPGNLQGMLGYHPQDTCCKACWDTSCNACWDSTPPLWTDAHL